MERADIEKNVKTIIAARIPVDADRVVPDARIVEDLGADSLDQVEIVMELEDAFDLEIPDEDAQKLQTVQEAIDYVCVRKAVA